MADEAKTLKDTGNQYFKEGRYDDALECYTKALNLNSKCNSDRAIYYKNRAACYLKVKEYEKAAGDCSAVLDINPNDDKALFRRAQAMEGMGRAEDAYRDAMTLLRVDPKNTAIQPLMARLNPIIQEKVQQLNMTDNKVSKMFDLTFKNSSGDIEKQRQAAQNLIVLAREEAGAQKIFQSGGIEELTKLIESTDGTLQLTGVRVLACLALNCKERATSIYEKVTLKVIIHLMSMDNEEISTAAANLLQNIIVSVTNLEKIRKERDTYETNRKADVGSKLRPYPFISEKIDVSVIPIIDAVFNALIGILAQGKVSAFGRDNAMELFIKFLPRKDACGWCGMFMSNGGVQGILEVAGTVVEHKTLPITASTRMHASLVLSKCYDDLLSDDERSRFRGAVDLFFDDMFGDNIEESKLEAIMALAALLQGPYEVGNYVLGRTGVLEIILAMADSDNAIHTKYAVEALVHSASKKERCSGVIKQATPILKQLYQSKNDFIKVRALVGLCKLGSFGGSDASAKSFADGSTQTLSKACRKFLKNPSKDVDMRKWAVEGLAYLTLDADVKEDLVEDQEALDSLIELAKILDKNILYPVAQTLVNLTNSYDKKKPDPELVELAKFSKHHVPEEHDKDKDPYVSERIKKLVKAGVINALVALSKTESENSKELLARVYLAVAEDKMHRGLLIQQGGAKALIPLATSGTQVGKFKASLALAKVAITNNPEIAFPGQRMCEIVKPLLGLLDIEQEALENFEALMALTNLASMSDTVRKRILKEKGFSKIEYYAYDEHPQLKTASLECICNLTMCDEVISYYQGDNDRVKYLVLTCIPEEEMDEMDLRNIVAAAGSLAMLTRDEAICEKLIRSTTQWHDALLSLAANEIPHFQHRGLAILNNLMSASKEIAEKLVEGAFFEVLMVVSRLEQANRQGPRECAVMALEKAVEWGLIAENKEAGGKSYLKHLKKDIAKRSEEAARATVPKAKKRATSTATVTKESTEKPSPLQAAEIHPAANNDKHSESTLSADHTDTIITDKNISDISVQEKVVEEKDSISANGTEESSVDTTENNPSDATMNGQSAGTEMS